MQPVNALADAKPFQALHQTSSTLWHMTMAEATVLGIVLTEIPTAALTHGAHEGWGFLVSPVFVFTALKSIGAAFTSVSIMRGYRRSTGTYDTDLIKREVDKWKRKHEASNAR